MGTPAQVSRGRPRVVVVGAGFGGLRLARALRRDPVDVVVVDRANYHLFQPLLYQVATAALEPADIAYPVRGILRRLSNATFRLGTVTGADWSTRSVVLDGGARLGFDFLVLAAGAQTATFGVGGVEEHAFALKTLGDALALRSHLLELFEEADADPSRIDEGWLTTVVVGGGPTGVETAGALSELTRRVLARDFPRLDVGRVRIVLVELTDSVLSPFRPRLRAHAAERLTTLGVELRLGEQVAEVSPGGVRFAGGDELASRTVVWAAGVRASPLGEALGLPLGAGGRVRVDRDLSVPGHRGVWAIGDVAASPPPRPADGQALPQVAQVALQGGKHVAGQIRGRLRGQPATPFRYRDPGTMATIGRRAAVAQFPFGIGFRGTIGWLMWVFLHLLQLVGFRNRVSVFVDWAWNYLTWDRASRLILREPQRRPAPTAGDGS